MKRITKVMKRLFTLVLCLSLIASLCTIALTARAAVITTKGVDIVYTNPGEDCSTEMIISWHAKSVRSEIYYTLKTDINYTFATRISVAGVYDDTSFTNYDVAHFYKCSVKLTGLDPDTEYIYKIKCDDYVTTDFNFRTAGASEYTFGYMSDIHAIPYDNLELGMTAVKKLQTVQKLIQNAEQVNNTKLAFIMTTGDETWRGSQYTNWLEWSKTQYVTALHDYLWLSCPGNHEYYTQTNSSVWNYYPTKYENNTSAIYSDPEYYYNTYFNAAKSVPQNGPEGIPSSYYTLYNTILFICIDSMQVGDYGQLNKTRAWFEEVVQKNEGKYQYIIVFQHYPWYDFVTGEDKYAYRWNDLFDKYGVDLALSGHMHGYLRTKSLYNGKESTDEGKGTVYVVSPQIGDRPKVISDYKNERLIAYRESTKTWTDYSAMSTITVSDAGLTYKLIDVDGKVRDTFTVPARRALSINDTHKDAIIKSLTLAGTPESIVCDFKSAYSVYLDEVKLEVGGKSVTANPKDDRIGEVEATGLNNNTLYDAKVTLKFIDGSTYETTASVLTTSTFGLIDNLEAVSANGKMNVTWDVSNPSAVSEYKLYLNGSLETTASTNAIALDLSKVDFSTKYTLEAYKDSNLLFRKDFYYNIYGDVNLDGAVNSADVTKLVDMVLEGYEFNDGAIKLLDNNHDGIVDIGDAFKILAYEQNKVNYIVYNEYDVTFIDKSGKTLAKVKVSEGGNATAPDAPEVEGYTFVGWSISYSNVTSDLIVRAMYEAK